MGNAAGKEFSDKELAKGFAHDDGKNSFSAVMITKEAKSLTGKTKFGKKPGYEFLDAENTTLFKTQAEGAMGRKGEVCDGDGNLLAYVRIDHKMKESVQSFYKTESSYEGQEAAEGVVEGKSLFLFAKIETSRSGSDIHSTYSVATGKDEFKALYKAKRVITPTFKALIETAGDEEVAVGKITSVMGLPKLKLEVASGVDLAAVILVGEAVAPNGDTVAQLPGASIGF